MMKMRNPRGDQGFQALDGSKYFDEQGHGWVVVDDRHYADAARAGFVAVEDRSVELDRAKVVEAAEFTPEKTKAAEDHAVKMVEDRVKVPDERAAPRKS